MRNLKVGVSALIVFDTPTDYDISGSPAQFRDPSYYSALGIPVAQDGAVPFVKYVIREKGKVEVGVLACGPCHTRVMPDGTVTKNSTRSPSSSIHCPPRNPNTTNARTNEGRWFSRGRDARRVIHLRFFEHSGSVATLEDWFDLRRLRNDYVPTGFKGYGIRTRAVKGHEFGLHLSPEDKAALMAFLRTL